VGGKRPRRRQWQLNSFTAGGELLYLTDSFSGKQFLVDSGAARSVYPHRSALRSSGPSLVGADGRPIASWGTRRLRLQFGQQHYEFDFLLATVAKPILGNDFLLAHDLVLHARGRRLLPAAAVSMPPLPVCAAAVHPSAMPAPPPPAGACAGLPVQPPKGTAPSAPPPPRPDPCRSLAALLDRYKGLFSTSDTLPPPSHGVEHTIVTEGPPVSAKAHRLDPAKLRIVEKEFAALEAAGIVRRSDSPWSSPLHMVRKKDGGWRPCGDYRRLNLATVPDRYPLPNLQDFTAELAGCTWFAKVDLVKGFHQIPVAPQDIPKTAINTPCGLWEYLRMPFGLKNAAQSFQRLMDPLFRHSPGTFGYMDDHLEFGR
jgi:hypothetical protein